MKKKNFLSIFGAILLSLLFVTGCSTDGKTSKSENGNKSGAASEFSVDEIEKNVDQTEFENKYPDYQLTFDNEPGMESVTITNHDPYDFANLPNYQEVIGYGYVGLESDDIVYAIDVFIKDTGSYYSAEFDAETKELLVEDGDWRPEGDLEEFTAERLEMMDDVLQK